MLESLTSLVIVTALLLGSPGPVPIALAAIGAIHGFQNGIPFLIGILTGLAIAIALGSMGLSVLLESVPVSRTILGSVGGLYICYVAFKIASAPAVTDENVDNGPVPSFRDGMILNLLNPKAYAAFLALFSQFRLPLPDSSVSTIATAGMIFAVAVVVDIAWLAVGGTMKPLFSSHTTNRITRVIFGLLMVAAVALTFDTL